VLTGALLAMLTPGPSPARAHCDTLDGPVVAAAKAALQSGDVKPVLIWAKKDREAEVKAAFAKTLAVRGGSAQARDLADTWFFETLVRLHRAGEGAPYTGLKPAGIDPGPAVTGADRALETGSVDALAKSITGAVDSGIRERFARAAEARKHVGESVEAGREYVEAYVEFVHYVEGLHLQATGHAAHHEGGGEVETEDEAAHTP